MKALREFISTWWHGQVEVNWWDRSDLYAFRAKTCGSPYYVLRVGRVRLKVF